MKRQTTTLAIGSKIVLLIQDATLRGDGVMIRHNGSDVGIVRVNIMGNLVTDDGDILDYRQCRIYRTSVPMLRSLATRPHQTTIRYSDATLVVIETQGIWTWRTIVGHRTIGIGYSTHHDNALDAAYAHSI